MKSPWKYLIELASLGRTAKESASPPEAEIAKQNRLSAAPEEGTPAPLDRAEGAATPTVDASSRTADLTGNVVDPVEIIEQVAAAIRVDRPRAVDHASEGAPSAQRRPQTVPRRVRKTGARPVAVAEDIRPREAPWDVRSPPTLSEEVAALDEEVRQLRRQLTEKLRLQNKQLERLLSRFGAS